LLTFLYSEKMVKPKLLEIYCKSCKNPPFMDDKSTSPIGRNASLPVVKNQYRIKALELAGRLGNDEFLEKCVNCPYK